MPENGGFLTKSIPSTPPYVKPGKAPNTVERRRKVCGQNGRTCVVNIEILAAARPWPVGLEFRNYPCKEIVAEAVERKNFWDTRVDEAKRLQAVAKAVHEASSQARSAIVQRVFSESLDDVWRSVFTRLAPQGPFVPAFGIPTSSKTALELTLETVHTSGASGGSPQMMLSAGNLNTAALSLFIALHIAVEPLVPCLVFDDPVQSMDEVHVAQFAALVRTLSKRH